MRTVANWQARWRGLTRAEARALVEAQWDLLNCQIEKWRRPVGELLEWDSISAEPEARPTTNIQTLSSVGWAVTRAAAYGVFRPRCLVRSLAIQRMLRRRGVTGSAIRIGVRLRHGELDAHAWVELGGLVIGDSPAHVESFTRVTDHRLARL